MKLKPIALILLAVAATGAGYWWFYLKKSANGPLTLQGNVEVRQVNLGFKVPGRIEKLNVDEGDTVATGQTLASLDKVYFNDALAQVRAQRDQSAANYDKLKNGNRPEEIAQARAAVAEREAALTNARVILQRAQTLLNSPAGSPKSFDDAQAAERQADALLNSARAALLLAEAGFRKEDITLGKGQVDERVAAAEVAERNLKDADLIAPSKGTVLSRVREAGAIVAAGETVYVLSLTTPIWVRTYVSEPELGRVRPGMAVEIKTDTPGGKTFAGKVGFISPTAEFTPKTVETTELRTSLVYRLRIVVDDPTGYLRQGMPVTITASPPAPEEQSIASRG
jgi:HlyD family secretion protein